MYVEAKRVEYLDSVRGLAALLVLLSHIFGAFDWPPLYGWILGLPFVAILDNGHEAVCMFFVLSGYVLSKPYVVSPANATPRKIFLPTFYLRRLTRIWLPWFAVFLLSIMAKKYWFSSPATHPPVSQWLGQFWHAPVTTGDFLRQCAFVLHDNTRQLLNQDWSLGVELKGSLLIPLLVFLLHRWRKVWLLLLAIGLPVGCATGAWYVSFILGVLLARYGEGLLARLPSGRLTKGWLLLLGLSLYQSLGWLITHYPGVKTVDKCGWIATSIGCVLVLLAVFSSRSLQTVLNARPLVFLGRISYSVYLVQFIVILCCLPPLVRQGNTAGWPIPVLFAATVVAGVAGTVGLSAVTYRIMEVPAINLGHDLTRLLQARLKKETSAPAKD